MILGKIRYFMFKSLLKLLKFSNFTPYIDVQVHAWTIKHYWSKLKRGIERNTSRWDAVIDLCTRKKK